MTNSKMLKIKLAAKNGFKKLAVKCLNEHVFLVTKSRCQKLRNKR